MFYLAIDSSGLVLNVIGVTAQTGSVLQRAPETRLIGIRSPVRRHWPEVIERDGARFRVLWWNRAWSCASASRSSTEARIGSWS